jgi:hypothetical protein
LGVVRHTVGSNYSGKYGAVTGDSGPLAPDYGENGGVGLSDELRIWFVERADPIRVR